MCRVDMWRRVVAKYDIWKSLFNHHPLFSYFFDPVFFSRNDAIMIPRPSLLLRRSSLSEYRPSPASDSFKSSQEDSGLELSEVECLLQVDSLK